MNSKFYLLSSTQKKKVQICRIGMFHGLLQIINIIIIPWTITEQSIQYKDSKFLITIPVCDL